MAIPRSVRQRRILRQLDWYLQDMGEEAYRRQVTPESRKYARPEKKLDAPTNARVPPAFAEYDPSDPFEDVGVSPAPPPESRRPRRSKAQRLLREQLRAGARRAAEIYEAAAAADVSARTLKRAKQELGVQSQRRGFGRGSVVYWLLPKRSPEPVVWIPAQKVVMVLWQNRERERSARLAGRELVIDDLAELLRE